MSVVAVDLAAKYSAAVMLDGNGCVETGLDSATCDDETLFIQSCVDLFRFNFCEQLVIEDLPHGVGYRALVKRVCQIQGRFVDQMQAIGKLDHLMFVAPETWRRHYPPLRKRAAGMEAVIPIAAELGFTPPALPHLAGPRGGNALITKVSTDYCAAYLIGRWALHTSAARDGWHRWPGTARYGEATVKKSEDIDAKST